MRRFKLSLMASVATLAFLLGSQAYATSECPRELTPLIMKAEEIGKGWTEIARMIHPGSPDRVPTRDAVRMVAHWRYSSLAILKCMDEVFRDGRTVLDPVGLSRSLVKKLAREAHKCIPMTRANEDSCEHLAMLGLMVKECEEHDSEPSKCPPPDTAAGKSSIEVWSDEPDPDDNIHLVIVVAEPPDDD